MLRAVLALVECVGLLAVVVVVQCAELDVPHLYGEKSFYRAVQDCMEYLQVPDTRYDEYVAHRFPSDPETKCLVRCVGLSLRWWNDTTGVQPALMANFFQPDAADTEYERRTAKCLDLRLASADPTDCCSLAYESYMCYLQHYGDLVPDPQFLPDDHSRHVRMAYDCINLLQVPEALLRSFSVGTVRDAPETRCLLRCFYIRSGVFHPETGFDLERLYARDFEHADARYLAPETYAKLHNLRSSGCDECTEVFLAYRGLLAELGNPYYEDGVLRDAAILALGDGSCGKRQPAKKQPLKQLRVKSNPLRYIEPTKVAHYPGKDHEEVAYPSKELHEPTTTVCPATKRTTTTVCPPKQHEQTTTTTTPCPPVTTTPAPTTSTTTESPSTKVFNYRQKNCETCGRMFRPTGGMLSCPSCCKHRNSKRFYF